MSELKCLLSADRQSVKIVLPTDPPSGIELRTEALEQLIKTLGTIRYSMEPKVPRDFSRGQKVDGIKDPRWRAEPEALEGHTVLHIRDPHYGWRSYLIPKEHAKKLSGLLAQHVADDTPLRQPKSLN